MVQSVGLTVELPIDDLRLPRRHGRGPGGLPDWNYSAHPSAPELTCEKVYCLSALVGHCILVVHPISIPSLDSPLVVRSTIGFITVVLHQFHK